MTTNEPLGKGGCGNYEAKRGQRYSLPLLLLHISIATGAKSLRHSFVQDHPDKKLLLKSITIAVFTINKRKNN